MNHRDIEERNLVELYVARRLGADDTAGFEEHFVDCPQCLDQIESAERLKAGLRRTTAVKPSQPHAWRWGLAAAATLLLVSGLIIWQAARGNRLEAELATARAGAAEWKTRFEAEAANVRRTPAPAPLVASTFALNLSRSSENAGTPPANRIIVAAGAPWIVLTLDRDWEPGFESLRATLSDAKSKTLWQQGGLVALAGVPLSMAVPAALLETGDFVLAIEGKAANSTALQPVGRYRFRVTRPEK